MKKIAIIGLGNLGYHLGDILHNSGFRITEIVHKNKEESKFFENRWETKAVPSPSSVSCDIVFICVQDRFISGVIQQLPIDKWVLTTSGTYDPVSAFPQHYTGVFYPLQTFSKNRDVDWRSVPVLLSSTSVDIMHTMRQIAEKIAAPHTECSTQQRQGYHLAAVWVNNFVNFILDQANQLCDERHLDFNLLEPLLKETIAKQLNSKGSILQTGPAIRGDHTTISTHMGLLNKEQQDIYLALTEFIQKQKKDA
jgi:predicted short-subunit dehydrogenase-like oxidoreductase (DUF2520 family)